MKLLTFTIQLDKEAELSMEKKYQILFKKVDSIETKCDARFKEWEDRFLRHERDQETIEARLQKKFDEIIPRIESLAEAIKTIKMDIAQLDQRISILIKNHPGNEERKSEVEQEVQKMKSNEFHSLIQLSIRKIVREDDQSTKELKGIN